VQLVARKLRPKAAVDRFATAYRMPHVGVRCCACACAVCRQRRTYLPAFFEFVFEVFRSGFRKYFKSISPRARFDFPNPFPHTHSPRLGTRRGGPSIICLRAVRDAPPQDAPPQMTQRTSWLCLHDLGQEIPEVSYPTDLSNGYKIGPECRKNSKCTWNRQEMAQYGSPARHTCLGGVLQSCLGVYDYSAC
jgi:hypothetical protein